MVNSPISIPLPISQSRTPGDLAKTQALAADALKIEHYINARMDTDYIREFDFATLAADLSIDRVRVCTLLSKLTGHENGITVCNPQKRPRTPPTAKVTSRNSSQSDADAPAWIAPVSIASEATF
jgi:hypothetical protein